MNEELKPCPFCGHQAIRKCIPGDWGYTASRYYIGCSGCFAHTDPYLHPDGDYISIDADNFPHEPINEWNTRADHNADASKMMTAAGPWRTDEPPRDGTWVVGEWTLMVGSDDDKHDEQFKMTLQYDAHYKTWTNEDGSIETPSDPNRWAALNLDTAQ